MGAISTITVADATPTNHDFAPTGISQDGVARWLEKTASVPAGFLPLSVSLRPPVPGSSDPVYRFLMTLNVPTLVTETINGVARSSLERTIRYKVEAIMPATSTLAERQHATAYVKNLLAHAGITDVVNSLNNVW